jgi:hypothetical protein
VISRFDGRATRRRTGITGNLNRLHLHGDVLPVRQFDVDYFRHANVGKMGLALGIIEIAEFQRKHIGDDLLRIGRQLHRGEEIDRALAIDDSLRAGLIDGCDRRQRRLRSW